MISLSNGNATGVHDNGQSFTFNWNTQPAEWNNARAIAALQAGLAHENDTTATAYLQALNVAQQAANTGQSGVVPPTVPLMHTISDDGTDAHVPFVPALAVFIPPAVSTTKVVAATGTAMDVLFGNAKAVAPTADPQTAILNGVSMIWDAVQKLAAKQGVTL